MKLSKSTNWHKLLREMFPAISMLDILSIAKLCRNKKFNKLPPSITCWLCSISYIRHNYTEYDTLLQDGYDQETARYYTIDCINNKLEQWQSKKLLSYNEDLPG